MNNPGKQLENYNTKFTFRQLLSFSVLFVTETLGRRRISRLMQCRIGRPNVHVSGIENLPNSGSFTLATNHFRAGLSIAVISALITATLKQRPDLKDDFLLVVGNRVNSNLNPDRISVKLTRRILKWLRSRWANSILHIPIGNERPSISFLREWRIRCQRQPVIIFPEGEGSLQFKPVRQGAGRWLSSFPAPTIPVGVWWHKNIWHVRFGPAMEWSTRSELRDVQLGLSIAALLPKDIAAAWQEDLQRWKSAHNGLQPRLVEQPIADGEPTDENVRSVAAVV